LRYQDADLDYGYERGAIHADSRTKQIGKKLYSELAVGMFATSDDPQVVAPIAPAAWRCSPAQHSASRSRRLVVRFRLPRENAAGDYTPSALAPAAW